MALVDDCQSYFGTTSLYEVLSIDKKASTAELKKAFKKASLLCHPDKVAATKKEEATRKFQVLAKVHYILSDPDKRAVYDETGTVEDENVLSMDDSSPEFWQNYFRTLFPKVTEKQIVDFMSKYKGSKDETKDLIELYTKFEGDMDKISEYFISYEFNEEERICETLKELIKKGEIPSFPLFVNEPSSKKTKRRKKEKKREKEAAEAEELAAPSLLTAMSRRQEERKTNFDNMISSLEDKYGKKDSGKKKKKV